MVPLTPSIQTGCPTSRHSMAVNSSESTSSTSFTFSIPSITSTVDRPLPGLVLVGGAVCLLYGTSRSVYGGGEGREGRRELVRAGGREVGKEGRREGGMEGRSEDGGEGEREGGRKNEGYN